MNHEKFLKTTVDEFVQPFPFAGKKNNHWGVKLPFSVDLERHKKAIFVGKTTKKATYCDVSSRGDDVARGVILARQNAERQ